MSTRSVALGGTSYPVTLPSLRDPRLHVAAVIVTIHVLGQTTLHFQVTVPQILAAILTCAVIEVAITFRARRAFVWPASAMLTGSGVALILRVPGTPLDDHWSTYAWWVFAGVAAFALMTKYLIRYRGSHVFNPSNIGLVIVFVVFGSTRVEPLDFWWAPLGSGMLLAYAVILVGGLLITARLGLLATAVTFWLTLAAGIGVLAASGHCMVARWAFAPVCGFDYWRVIITSPEILIFLFFMITDPKTVPTGRRSRIAFGFLVAVASTLLMAPQTTEFGTKVALLGGLAVVCAGRPIADRLLVARHARAASAAEPTTDRRVGGLPALLLRGALFAGAGGGAGDGHRRRRRAGAGRRHRERRRRAGPGPPPGRPGYLPLDHRPAGRPRLEPRDHRRRGAGDRPDPRREPRARERGAAAGRPDHPHRGRPRRPPGRDADAAEPGRGRAGRPWSTATRSTTST